MSRSRNKRRRPTPRAAAVQKAPHASDPARSFTAAQPYDRAIPVEELIQQLTSRNALSADPLPRDPRDNDLYGPGTALYPAPLDPVRPDSGRADPRGYEYGVSWNLRLGGEKLIPWHVLRDAADNIDIIRDCIRVRKRHLRNLKWSWTVSPEVIQEAYQKDPRRGQDDIAAELREKYAPEIKRLTAFWTNPWRGHLKSLGQWINMLWEEYLVLDAIAIYPERTYGGDVYRFRIIDGSTIKPLLNYQGNTPEGGHPAYQQILYGFPRGEYLATVTQDQDGQDVIDGGLPSDQLFYFREDTRSNTPYGSSPVEQALIAARLYLKRQGWMMSEYDDGTAPVTWLIPEGSGAEELDFRQRRKWEDALNDELSGHTAARHRIKVTPPGFKPETVPNEAERYKPEYDLHLIKLMATKLSVTIAELGFTEAKGLGSSGYHEGQEDVQDRIGRRPDTEVLSEIIEGLSRDYLGAPPELVFQLTGLEAEDEAAQDQVAQNRVGTARMLLNEDRRRQGLPLYNFAEADMPMVITQRGVIFLEGASQQAAPGELIEPVQGPKQTAPPEGADASPDSGTDTQAANNSTETAKPAGGKPAPKDNQADTTKAATLSKEEAGYRTGVDALHRCRNCSMYRVSGDDDSGTCTLVKGIIAGDAVCDHWEARSTVAGKAADPTRAVADSDSTADRVRAQLADDYPPDAMAWIDGAHWSGPESVPTADIDYSDAKQWQASSEPDKVARFTRKIRAGKLKPIILVNTPDDRRYIIIDGHHRALAYRQLGVPAMAYIGTVPTTAGPWDEMHASQRVSDDPDSTAGSGTGKSAAAAGDEAAAFRRWLRKHTDRAPARPFRFEQLSQQAALEAGLLTPTQVGSVAVFAKAGDAGPKASARSWPGWERDREIAAHYATRIRQALTAAVDMRVIADQWAQARNLTAKDAASQHDAATWLNTTAVPAALDAALTAVLNEAYTEGYAIGDRSAIAMVTGAAVDWGAWIPGDPDAARLVLGDDGLGAGLQQLLDNAGIRIKSLGSGRFDQLAQALAAALEGGDSPDTLAETLAGILDAPQWAEMVAVTEINRAISASTLQIYGQMGVEAKDWLTALDDRVCPTICEPNSEDGPVPLNGVFSSGVDAPPGHPNCRCALGTATLTGTEAAYALADAGLTPGEES